ncbi:LysR family transcriptional regulator [Bdellovibrio bacteriovorus]|uniref:LysR family transcriptional regulator n=1 Tax=Bdellovibrio TaxID=958 RepID=UPI0035A87339
MKTEELSLSALKYFFDVVETQSLTKAAELNFVTRPAISQAVLRLEEWVGKSLTTHRKKNFELTPAGEEFYRHMKASFLSFKKNVESSVRESHSLKIGCSSSLAESFLFPALKQFTSVESLHLVTGTSKQLSNLLDEEEIHMALFLAEARGGRKGIKIDSGSFVLASRDGRMGPKIVTTEIRPEVTALKRHLLRQAQNVSFLTVESWSLAAKLAYEINCVCLVPEFLIGSKLKKIPLRGFKPGYEVILRNVAREKMSTMEMQLLTFLSTV